VHARSYLGLNIQYAALSLALCLVDGVEACAVKIARKFGMFYEGILFEQTCESVA